VKTSNLIYFDQIFKFFNKIKQTPEWNVIFNIAFNSRANSLSGTLIRTFTSFQDQLTFLFILICWTKSDIVSERVNVPSLVTGRATTAYYFLSFIQSFAICHLFPFPLPDERCTHHYRYLRHFLAPSFQTTAITNHSLRVSI
jgi:hypothetical protein